MDNGAISIDKWLEDMRAPGILHTLPDAVFITDPLMRITYFNSAAEELLGFKYHDSSSKFCKDTLRSGLCEAQCVVRRSLDDGMNIFNIETTIPTPSGKIIPVLMSASVIKDTDSKLVGYLHVVRDISFLKKVMADLEISRTALSEKNTELYEALEELKITQEQFLQAQKMEALGTLAGGIAHDFNNILTGIMGFASLIEREVSETGDIYQYVKQIERAAARAAELTGKIMTFARRGCFETMTTNLNKVIADVAQILERTVDKEININRLLSPEACYADIDSVKMEQALMNVCINSVEAMPQGGEITMKTEISFLHVNGKEMRLPDQPAVKEYIRISVTDTGVGMDNETRKRMFDPFFTTKGKSGGTGLGLAMVYGVIRDFGGYIEVESKQGDGTVVNIYLPVTKHTMKNKDKRGFEKSPDIPKGIGETILLVDDEDVVRKLGINLLVRLGYNILIAEDGLAAIDIYKKQYNVIKLVILDLIMPRFNGEKVFERLREINPEAKIIITTGYAKEELLKPLLEKRVNGFLKKPYRIEDMAEVVRSVIDLEN